MAATEVDVCNLALASINFDPITTLADNTQQARLCSRFFDESRDELLREHAWGFATRRIALDDVEDDPLNPDHGDSYPGYLYAYEMPDECLRILKVYNESEPDVSYPYELLFSPTDGTPGNEVVRICANVGEAVCEYVYRVETVTFWDAHFVRAMVAYLAFKLAHPLRATEDLRRWSFSVYQDALERAKRTDSSESKRDPALRPNRYKDAR